MRPQIPFCLEVKAVPVLASQVAWITGESQCSRLNYRILLRTQTSATCEYKECATTALLAMLQVDGEKIRLRCSAIAEAEEDTVAHFYSIQDSL